MRKISDSRKTHNTSTSIRYWDEFFFQHPAGESSRNRQANPNLPQPL